MNAVRFFGALGKIDDGYVMEAIAYRRKMNGSLLKWGVMAACFGLMLTAVMIAVPGILNRQSGTVPPAGPDVSAPAVGDGDETNGAEPLQPPEKQEIIIDWEGVAVNESTGVAPDAARLYRDPELYVDERWGEEEVVARYGWNLAPAYIPEGLTSGGRGVSAGVWRERATGEIVEEQAGRGFWSDFWEDGNPKSDDEIYIPTGFTVRASRLGILHCALLPVDESQTTDFGGTPVTLNHCSLPYGPFDPTQKAPDGLHNMPAGYYDIYVASFTWNGAEYEIEAHRLELEEVVKITASVLNVPRSGDFTVGNGSDKPSAP